jgi:hypothetical protein
VEPPALFSLKQKKPTAAELAAIAEERTRALAREVFHEELAKAGLEILKAIEADVVNVKRLIRLEQTGSIKLHGER